MPALAHADVITVDDDGGVGIDHTDIQPAVDAADPGDLILVHPGDYGSFVLAEGVTILGTGAGVKIASGSRVTGVPAGQKAVLADLMPVDLRVLSSQGTIVLDNVDMPLFPDTPLPERLFIDGSMDVRVLRCDLGGNPAFGGDGVRAARVRGARAEFVQSNLAGEAGEGTGCGVGDDGGSGLLASNAARVHLSMTNALGGDGGYVGYTCGALCNGGAGNGAEGLQLSSASVLYAMGVAGTHAMRGGFAGDGGDCPCDGYPGTGLMVNAATAIYSGASPEGGGAFCFGSGSPVSVSGGGTATEQPLLDPFMELTNTPAPGAVVRLTVWGEPGDVAQVRLGRSPALIDLPGVMIEQLTSEQRTIPIGTIGAAGNATLLLTVFSGAPQGLTFYAQGVLFRSGQELRTNSTPLVVR